MTPRFPVLYCAKCMRGEATTVCRWCSHDKLADLCARAAQTNMGESAEATMRGKQEEASEPPRQSAQVAHHYDMAGKAPALREDKR